MPTNPKVAARRARFARIRRSVAALTTAAFIAVFGTVYAHQAHQDTTTTTAMTTAATTSNTSSSSNQLAPVTTQQS